MVDGVLVWLDSDQYGKTATVPYSEATGGRDGGESSGKGLKVELRCVANTVTTSTY